MSRFQVDTQALAAAASQVGRSETTLSSAHGGLQGLNDVFDPLAGTPAQMAFINFVGAAGTAAGGLQEATTGLARALADAAAAYDIADESAAKSVGGR
jgi:uncharacterized protein YukE